MHTRTIRLSRVAALLLVAAGCAKDDTSNEWQSTTTKSGDTTIVTTVRGGSKGATTLDSVSVIWSSDTLGRPSHVLVAGADNLAIADGDHIFIIGQDGSRRSTLGRSGEGPGEFRSVGAYGARGDTIVALDKDNRHFSVFSASGGLLATGTLQPIKEYVNLTMARVGFDPSGIVVAWNSIIDKGAPGTVAAVRSRWTGDSASIIHTVIGQPYVFGPQGVARAMLFGPNPMAAVSANGRVAFANGVDYCVETMGTDGASWIRICRAWDRVPVPASVRNPDWNAIAAASGRPVSSLESVRGVVSLMKVADHHNAIDRLFWDTADRLWVQAVDSSSAKVHPILARMMPDMLPSHARWDVYSVKGQLLMELSLPRAFIPTDAIARRVFGLFETEAGDYAVAAIELPVGRKE